MPLRFLIACAFAALLGCGAPSPRPQTPVSTPPAAAAPTPQGSVTLSVVGTSDFHGHVERIGLLGGYVQNLRRAREAEGGAVLLVDGGDLFQGTLASNLAEGAPVVRAFDVLGYHAATVGNHEFDYGPVGPAATPQSEMDDPRGALLARAAEAEFSMLAANLLVAATGEPIDWENIAPTQLVEAAGVRVGIVGITTLSTLHTTISANVHDLAIAPLAASVASRGRALREAGADVVIVVAHAGGECTEFDDPDDLSSCDDEAEIFEVARALPTGLVDVIVAGHTHKAIAHRVAGIAILQSHAYGRAFGRVDLTFDIDARRVSEVRIHPPREICHEPRATVEDCQPGDYEGAPVIEDPRVVAAVAPDVARAETVRARSLGVQFPEGLPRGYDFESPLGNLLADLMREARPEADVALLNGGGVRADFPAGELTYGSFYETFPFDNRFATVRMPAGELAAMLAHNLGRDRGILIVSGLSAEARCRDGELEVRLRDARNRLIRPERELVLVTSDFLATGGDGAFTRARERQGAVTIDDGPPMREALAERLQARGGAIAADEASVAPGRLRFEGERPVSCP